MMRAVTSLFNAGAIAAVCLMPMAQSASAVTAEVARKCRELTVKAHPPVTAGSKTGAAQVERAYFRACVAQGGNVKDDVPKEEPKK
jgi:hypothetical protein